MTDPIKHLVLRAFRAGVRFAVIADPGLPPFQRLCEYFLKKRWAEALDWTTGRPLPVAGRILKIGAV